MVSYLKNLMLIHVGTCMHIICLREGGGKRERKEEGKGERESERIRK